MKRIIISISLVLYLITGVNAQNQYNFKGSYTIEMESTDNGKASEKVIFKVHNEVNSQGYAIETFDKNNKGIILSFKDKMIVISPKDKQAVIMKPGMFQMQKNNPKTDRTDYKESNWAKTGKVKTINGYKCEEYLIESPEQGNLVMWITTEVPFNTDWMNTYPLPFIGSIVPHDKQNKGFMMEMEVNNLQEQSKAVMKIAAINVQEQYSINLLEYEVVDMNQMMNKGNN